MAGACPRVACPRVASAELEWKKLWGAVAAVGAAKA